MKNATVRSGVAIGSIIKSYCSPESFHDHWIILCGFTGKKWIFCCRRINESSWDVSSKLALLVLPHALDSRCLCRRSGSLLVRSGQRILGVVRHWVYLYDFIKSYKQLMQKRLPSGSTPVVLAKFMSFFMGHIDCICHAVPVWSFCSQWIYMYLSFIFNMKIICCNMDIENLMFSEMPLKTLIDLKRFNTIALELNTYSGLTLK